MQPVNAGISARDRLILPLDTASLEAARQLVDELRDWVGMFKVGLQLFCNEGPSLFETLHRDGVSVFFDGKFKDIPNTVARATEAVVARGLSMFNVHATGGSEMMRRAVAACDDTCRRTGMPRPKVLAVTVLTSIGPAMLKEELGVAAPMEEQVCRLAALAKGAGCDGVVASGAEVAGLRKALGPDFLLVTPGVRPHWAAADDQSRIVTPGSAIKDGSDYLVIGRPILGAADRREAAKRIVAEIEQAL